MLYLNNFLSDKMKNNLLFICIFIFLLSCNPLRVQEFNSITDVINHGTNQKKANLIYFYSSDCLACELLDMKVLADKQVRSYIKENFIFYRIDVTKHRDFNKILYAYAMPLICIVETDEFENVFYPSTEIDLFLFSLKNYKSIPFHASLSGVTNLKGDSDKIAHAMNLLLKLLNSKENNLITKDSLRLGLENTVEIFPYFYNQYLLARSYGNDDSLKAKAIYKKLIDHMTGLDEMLYRDEVKEMYKWYYNLENGNKGDIRFEHMSYDFGEVRAGIKVCHAFPFVNNSHSPLLIYSVNTSCGCTTPYWVRHPLLYGERDSVKVELLINTPGKVSKEVHVVTNSEKRVTNLTVTAYIK